MYCGLTHGAMISRGAYAETEGIAAVYYVVGILFNC